MFLLACHSSVADGFTIPQKPKTLLQILVEELPKNGGWPDGGHAITQDSDRAINIYKAADGLETNEYGTWRYSGNWLNYVIMKDGFPCLAVDQATAIITRDQYEAALAASKEPLTGTGVDGWIDWAGGECPVEKGTLVDVRLKNGITATAQEALKNNSFATYPFWRKDDAGGDIIAYRLHQPQDANSRANDDRIGFHVHRGVKGHTTGVPDEADLNDCIGQASPDSVMRWNLLDHINEAGIQISLCDAIELANTLIDAGYRKQ